MKPARRSPWLLAVSPWRALLESWIAGIILGAFLLLVIGESESGLLTQGVLVLSFLCAVFAALRWSPPSGSRRQRLWRELLVSAGLSFVMVIGLLGPESLLGLTGGADRIASFDLTHAALLLASGPMALGMRLAIWVWLRWDHLRRTKLVWSLTHAHLVLVVGLATLMALPLALFSVIQSTSGGVITSGDPVSAAGSTFIRMIVAILPTGFLVIGCLVIVVAFVLPPAALVSYFVARRSTRRIEELARATTALRQGHYSTRVVVDGEDELGKLQENFNATAAELERTLAALAGERNKVAALLRAQQELTAGVSHELRTPVATIQGYLEPALERWGEQSPADLRQDLETVQREVDRLGRLIDDLLALSRSGAGALEIHPVPVSLAAIAGRVHEALGPLAWENGRVEIAVEMPDDLPEALADPDRVQQILTNLVRNGASHTPPGGFVVILAAAEPDAVRIEVRDTGEGIAPAELEQIWQRFYRGNSAGRQAGHGLGLAVVKELAEAMGGRVAVESTLDEGSVFTVWLPRTGRRASRDGID